MQSQQGVAVVPILGYCFDPDSENGNGYIFQLRAKGEEFWEGPNRRFVLAVGAGGIATLGAYMSLAIWADSSSDWMALSLILQNLGTIAILWLLLQQGLSKS